jgi:hypothetical protein
MPGGRTGGLKFQRVSGLLYAVLKKMKPEAPFILFQPEAAWSALEDSGE